MLKLENGCGVSARASWFYERDKVAAQRLVQTQRPQDDAHEEQQHARRVRRRQRPCVGVVLVQHDV